MTDISVVELSVFASRLIATCDEMGATLRRAAFSPNIKDRLDYSCAVFDPSGELCAQAAHIPVHLGSMAYAMVELVKACEWQPGDVLVVNDPYLGGTHLPDVTVIAPVFLEQAQQHELVGFVANRAHHANIGASQPGSMPIANRLEEEGEVIPPTLLLRSGQWRQDVLDRLTGNSADFRLRGDFYAQVSASQLGSRRLAQLVTRTGRCRFRTLLAEMNDYGEQLARAEWRQIPHGQYRFEDMMEDDGRGSEGIAIRLCLTVSEYGIDADFTGTAAQVGGNINCPLSVTAAAVYYALRCLLPRYTPACAGSFRPISIRAPEGSLVNALRPSAVAAGNVETSSRIVDVMFGALAQAVPERIPAASQGTMNNLAMGARARGEQGAWDYYETLAGGAGAGPMGSGASAIHTHMTNTLNTPVESIEQHYPVRVRHYAVRRASGGDGEHGGGDGVVREFEFLTSAQATLLTERRQLAPWGLNGAGAGKPGGNFLNDRALPGKVSLELKPGDRLRIETPGGGGWNTPAENV